MGSSWNMLIQMNRSGLTAKLQWGKFEVNTRLCTLQMSGSKLESFLALRLKYSWINFKCGLKYSETWLIWKPSRSTSALAAF